jgi:hypothetical protein
MPPKTNEEWNKELFRLASLVGTDAKIQKESYLHMYAKSYRKQERRKGRGLRLYFQN